MTDLLAKEYGWAQTEIWENVYLDDAYKYSELIKERKMGEAKERLTNFKILLSIIHTNNPKDTMQMLDEELNKINPIEPPKVPEFDAKGFEAFKNAMRANPRMVIKD